MSNTKKTICQIVVIITRKKYFFNLNLGINQWFLFLLISSSIYIFVFQVQAKHYSQILLDFVLIKFYPKIKANNITINRRKIQFCASIVIFSVNMVWIIPALFFAVIVLCSVVFYFRINTKFFLF